jgi:hypothetical protein
MYNISDANSILCYSYNYPKSRTKRVCKTRNVSILPVEHHCKPAISIVQFCIVDRSTMIHEPGSSSAILTLLPKSIKR